MVGPRPLLVMRKQPSLVYSFCGGLGFLDDAFRDAGYFVVRSPDLMLGGDAREIDGARASGQFDGVIGLPPVKRYSSLAPVNVARWGAKSLGPDLIPQFNRIVGELDPKWFAMVNVPRAPPPEVKGYQVSSVEINARWCGSEQRSGAPNIVRYGRRSMFADPMRRIRRGGLREPCRRSWARAQERRRLAKAIA